MTLSLDTTTILIMTLLLRILLMMITLNTGEVTYNDITYKLFYLCMTLLATVNKKHLCNVKFITVKSSL